jgi:hypothetical protein
MESLVNISYIQSILAIIAFCLLWGGSLWRIVKVNAQKETDLYAALERHKTDINNLGEKVSHIDTSCTTHSEGITLLRLEQQQSRDERIAMRERTAADTAGIRVLQEELQQERLLVMTTLHNNERTSAERDARTREELARISERLDIERMVTTVVRNLKGP